MTIIDDTHKAAFLAGYAEGMRGARDGFLAALSKTGQHVMRSAFPAAPAEDEIARGVAERSMPVPVSRYEHDEHEPRRRP